MTGKFEGWSHDVGHRWPVHLIVSLLRDGKRISHAPCDEAKVPDHHLHLGVQPVEQVASGNTSASCGRPQLTCLAVPRRAGKWPLGDTVDDITHERHQMMHVVVSGHLFSLRRDTREDV